MTAAAVLAASARGGPQRDRQLLCGCHRPRAGNLCRSSGSGDGHRTGLWGIPLHSPSPLALGAVAALGTLRGAQLGRSESSPGKPCGQPESAAALGDQGLLLTGGQNGRAEAGRAGSAGHAVELVPRSPPDDHREVTGGAGAGSQRAPAPANALLLPKPGQSSMPPAEDGREVRGRTTRHTDTRSLYK